MAYCCPRCGRQFDATLFEFGRTVQCPCGRTVDIRDGHRREAPKPPGKAQPGGPDGQSARKRN